MPGQPAVVDDRVLHGRPPERHRAEGRRLQGAVLVQRRLGAQHLPERVVSDARCPLQAHQADGGEAGRGLLAHRLLVRPERGLRLREAGGQDRPREQEVRRGSRYALSAMQEPEGARPPPPAERTEDGRDGVRSAPSSEFPPRYEAVRRLGAGGGGEVWSVRDRITGRVQALKVLGADAGDAETGALVREAFALSGLEGLGVPRVTAFGTLASGRRYMVRELVEGQSLEDVLERRSGPWVEPIASACDQLTVVHRAGLLHGDLKPANIIVGPDGHGTLVDLGMAAPWRDAGTAPQGLTPKYAAPELFDGEPLTVRAEVYAIGATLGEAIARRGKELSDDARAALFKVAARATEPSPAARWPSVDEFASALRRAAGLAPSAPAGEPPWPVLGVEAAAQSLLDLLREVPPGGALAIEGPRGAGKTTLARRLAWTLGVAGRAVDVAQAPESGIAMSDVVELELARYLGDDGASPAGRDAQPPVVVVDDAERLDDAASAALERASAAGALLVVVAPRSAVERLVRRSCVPFVVPPIDARAADELVQRSVPSLPDALRVLLVNRVGGRPGPLRAAVRRLAGRAIVSAEDVEAALAEPSSGSLPPTSVGRSEAIEGAERALDMGRFDEASRELDRIGAP